MQTFTHPQGQSHLYSLSPVDAAGNPKPITGNVSYAVDNSAIASVTPNQSVSQNLQCTVQYLTPGTANITCSAQDADGNAISTVFQAVVTAVTPDLAVGFNITEIS